MRYLPLCAGFLLLVFPVIAQAQQQNKEPILIQLFDDLTKSRQLAEIEAAGCKVQVKDLQKQLEDAKKPKEEKK